MRYRTKLDRRSECNGVLVARPILLTSTTIILGALIIHCLFFFLFLFFDPASRPAYLAERESLGQLFDANSYDLCAVCVLYWYVNWHFVLLPFLFVCFIFSLRLGVWRSLHAGCEHHLCFRKLVF